MVPAEAFADIPLYVLEPNVSDWDAFMSTLIESQVEVILNDALGPLLASEYEKGDTRVAVIFGTGTNMSYVESVANIRKLQGASEAAESMLINSEWSNFW